MKNLLKAINEVRKATKNVEKNGQNTFHKYSYVMAADVVREVREAMNAQGLICWPKEVKDIMSFKDGNVSEATVVYTVAHAESGESIEVAIRAGGEDKGDKKPFKTNTGALKYLFIQLFLLPTGDDPEGHNAEQDKGQRSQNQAGKTTNSSAGGVQLPWLNKGTKDWDNAIKKLEAGTIKVDIVTKNYKVSKAQLEELQAAEEKAGKKVNGAPVMN